MNKDANSAANQRRIDLEVLHEKSKEIGVDAVSLLSLAMEGYKLCMFEGNDSERVCTKGRGGRVTVRERYPAVALGYLQFAHKIVSEAQKELDKAPPPDTSITINVARRVVEPIVESIVED